MLHVRKVAQQSWPSRSYVAVILVMSAIGRWSAFITSQADGATTIDHIHIFNPEAVENSIWLINFYGAKQQLLVTN